ncbi:hypothetical protein [Streptomyces sp. NPDC005374]|uniref:hypothetical protein n=1 Tax=Streptomyces sp. NPDC005374 TaxID=3364713 RepID=UPI0036CDA05B
MFRTSTRPTARIALSAAGCAAVLGLALTATAPASAAPAAKTAAVSAPVAKPTDANGRYTAQEIHTFLETFYGEHGPGDFARAYGISEQLKEKVAASDGFDVLLCAQNEPQSIDIGPVTTAQSARVGYATVTTHWGENGQSTAAFEAYVDLDATRPIQLLDTDCEATG